MERHENFVAIFLIGTLVGFVSGLFGKGGSAIATPLLQLVGVPSFIAVAAPLPATIPATLAASVAYLKAHLYNWRVVGWSVAIGIPLTILGAWLSKFVGGKALLLASDITIILLGGSFLLRRNPSITSSEPGPAPAVRIGFGAGAVALVSGLLANSGGVLLAPFYIRVLRLPVHTAFACSLLVSAALAIPGTAVHSLLGHIDWAVVSTFAAGSIPLAYLGARLSIRLDAAKLEKLFGFALLFIGMGGVAEVLIRR